MIKNFEFKKGVGIDLCNKKQVTRNVLILYSTGDYTAMDGGLLHNKLIVIAGHN